MNWTKEQQKAIETRKKSMLVSAAAGSGKTAVLVERIKQLIEQDQEPLDRILVVTFTNAAASEMREKIVHAIPEQLHQIHKAHIGTFHSFALDVIRRYFHLISIEPNFKICDDTQRTLLQKDAMDRLFQKKFQEKDPDFLAFLKTYASSKNEEVPKSMILSVHAFLESMPEPMDWLTKEIDTLGCTLPEFMEGPAFHEILADVEEELAAAILSCEEVAHRLKEAELPKLLKKAETDLSMVKSAYELIREDYDLWTQAARAITFSKFVPTKEEKAGYELLKEDLKFLRDDAKEAIKRIVQLYGAKPLEAYLEEIHQTVNMALILKDLVWEFDALYRENKQKRGLIDFSDMEHYALEILKQEEAAIEYRAKFDYIFIDEYQDSNLVQERMIDRIKRKDNLFMVGDVKQSIYKFRLADPDLFISRYETYKTNQDPYSLKLDLNRNFRSKESIIDFVNRVFGKIMTKRTAGMEYDSDAALYKGVGYNGSLTYPVELHLVDDKAIDDPDLDDEIRDMKKAELEASVAVSLIREAKGLPYYDEKAGAEKQMQYRDIVLLLRSTAGIGEVYQEVFRREGIPSYLDIGDGFFDTTEVLVLLNLLNLIDNEKQDIPLLSALRSPIFGFSLDQLSVIRLAHKQGAYHRAFAAYQSSGSDPALSARCVEVKKQIIIWRRRARFLPLSDFLWELILESGYYYYVGALPGGATRQGNLRSLVDKALKYEANQGRGLFGFINYIEAMKKGNISTAPFKLIGESDDVVRIMTVHKSKGLEFPMVIVGNLGRSFHRESGQKISFHKELGLALKQVDREQHFWRRTILQSVIDRRKSREDLAEEIRILYVALTRPMDRLLLLGTETSLEIAVRKAELKAGIGVIKGNCYLDYLLPSLHEWDKIERYFHTRGSLVGKSQKMQQQKKKLLESLKSGFSVDGRESTEVERRLGWNYPYQEALITKSKYSVTELVREQPGKTKKAVSISEHSEGARIGTLYHKVMEHLPFHRGAMEQSEIEAFLEEMVGRDLLSKVELDEIDSLKIAAFFQSEIGQRVCRADQVYREVPFNLIKERNGEEIIVQGIIDCYFREGDKIILLDFKTNMVQDHPERLDLLAKRYEPQLRLYQEALENTRGIQIEELYLYLFSIGKELRIETHPPK